MAARRRLRVGVVGAGLIAQVMHLHHLEELQDLFEVGAVCDLSPTLRQAAGARFPGARQLDRWEEVVAEPLDAVLILTSGSHAPVAAAAARAGRHVFVEKPLAFSVREGREIVEAARAAGVRVMVGYNKRYDPAYARLREERPRIRDLRFVRVTTLESPYQPYVAQYPLTRADDVPADALDRLRAEDGMRVAQAVGEDADPLAKQVYRWMLLDSLVHELNAIRGLLGEPDRLDFADFRATSVTAVLSFGAVECVVAWVDLQDGIARYEMEFALYGPERRATLRFPSPFLRNAPTSLVLEGGEVSTARSWETVETASYEESFKRELQRFHECVVEGTDPPTSALDGLRDVALCEALVAGHVSRAPVPSPTSQAGE